MAKLDKGERELLGSFEEGDWRPVEHAERAPCLDLTQPFQRAARAGTEVYARTDTHWSPEGHALAAAEVAELLAKIDRLWEDREPGTPRTP